ncbi:MAG TPA: hypothetical protein VE010_08005 [Thermoanaerobaculia bacterium]|nr:hypothetical protein [Thermoanaerobaculia bacterium]
MRREVEARVQKRIATLSESWLAERAWRLAGRNDRATAEAKRKLSENLPQKIAAVVAEMQESDCECRKFVADAASTFLKVELFSRTAVSQTLGRLIRTKYAEVVDALLREFRIFTAANALMFLLLGVTTHFRRRAGLQLLLPAIVLIGAATLVGTLYLFGQDWLHTILFSDYVGLGYFAYLAAAIVLLLDVVFNHARVTTEILNALFNILGVAIQAVPC